MVQISFQDSMANVLGTQWKGTVVPQKQNYVISRPGLYFVAHISDESLKAKMILQKMNVC